MISPNISNIAAVATKSLCYCCIVFDVNKYHTINLLQNSVFDDLGYTKKADLDKGW